MKLVQYQDSHSDARNKDSKDQPQGFKLYLVLYSHLESDDFFHLDLQHEIGHFQSELKDSPWELDLGLQLLELKAW